MLARAENFEIPKKKKHGRKKNIALRQQVILTFPPVFLHGKNQPNIFEHRILHIRVGHMI